MHVRSCCFAYLNLLLFWRSRCCRRSDSILNSLKGGRRIFDIGGLEISLRWQYGRNSTHQDCERRTFLGSFGRMLCSGEYFSGCPVTYFKCMRSFVLRSTRFFAFSASSSHFWSKQDEIKLLMFCLFSRGFYGLSTDQLSWRTCSSGKIFQIEVLWDAILCIADA